MTWQETQVELLTKLKQVASKVDHSVLLQLHKEASEPEIRQRLADQLRLHKSLESLTLRSERWASHLGERIAAAQTLGADTEELRRALETLVEAQASASAAMATHEGILSELSRRRDEAWIRQIQSIAALEREMESFGNQLRSPNVSPRERERAARYIDYCRERLQKMRGEQS
jgi:hypothetical protein